MKPIRDPYIRQAASVIYSAGNPPPGKHWRCKGIGIGGVHAEAVKTIFASGNLRVQRGPKKDEFQYEIVDAETGLRVCGFGTKRIAIAFTERLGPTFARIFEDIWSTTSPHETREYGLLHKLISLFRHDDPGEDDGGAKYALERPEWGDARIPSAWADEKIASREWVLEGPCLVVHRGEGDGYSPKWVRRVKRTKNADSYKPGWLLFEHSASSENPYPYMREFKTLRGALRA